MTCPNGHKCPEGTAFCSTCGAALTAASAPAPAATSSRRPLVVTLVAVWSLATASVLTAAVLGILAMRDAGESNAIATPGTSKESEEMQPAATTPVLQAAHDACIGPKPAKFFMSMGDEGRTLVLADDGHHATARFYETVGCVLAALDTPDSVMTQIQNTTGLMGVREADNGSVHYEWTYNGETGLDLLITDKST